MKENSTQIANADNFPDVLEFFDFNCVISLTVNIKQKLELSR